MYRRNSMTLNSLAGFKSCRELLFFSGQSCARCPTREMQEERNGDISFCICCRFCLMAAPVSCSVPANSYADTRGSRLLSRASDLESVLLLEAIEEECPPKPAEHNPLHRPLAGRCEPLQRPLPLRTRVRSCPLAPAPLARVPRSIVR